MVLSTIKSLRRLDPNNNIITFHRTKNTSRWNRVVQPWKLRRLSLSSQTDIESVNGENQEHVDFAASQKASGTVNGCASKRTIACAPDQGLVLQESSRIELGCVGTKDCWIEAHLFVWHEYLVSRQEALASNLGFASNDTGANGVIRNPQDLLVEGREEWALIQEAGHVQRPITVQSELALLLD